MSSGSLMKNPMLRLEKIHRQAEGNPIIQLSCRIRETGEMPNDLSTSRALQFVEKKQTDEVLRRMFAEGVRLQAGVLCWKNRSRVSLNEKVRAMLGYSGEPKAGEIVVCLRNRPPVYNGMRGLMLEDLGRPIGRDESKSWIGHARMEFPEEDLEAYYYNVCKPQFGRETTFANVEECQRAGMDVWSMGGTGDFYDYGYAMTVHKAQGSQFSNAVFYLDREVEPNSEDWRRFAYTAVTRASERLTVIA